MTMNNSMSNTVEDYRLVSLETCLLFQTNEELVIDESSFLMAGGQELKVGDCFTSIDVRGSAGYPPLHLTDGWYQSFVGRVKVANNGEWLSGGSRTLMLFESFEIASGINALHHYPKKQKNNFISYLEMNPYGSMLYWIGCNSSRVIKCKEIKRYSPNQGTN